MKRLPPLLLLVAALPASGQSMPGSLDVSWHAGAPNCAATPQDPLQVYAYEPQTFILRQNPCAHFEANFLYLLVGSEKALLIDTGAVADPEQMPLAATVLDLLPVREGSRMPLIVTHSHSHGDHTAGDPQFASLSSVEVVSADLERVQAFFELDEWPNGSARLDLGGRIVEVIPAPGHRSNHLLFYDKRTGLVLSGDFLLPGRLLIGDAEAYRASAVRAIDFLENRPVTHILGGHIELDADGEPYSRGAQHHPNERRLELAKEELLALPAAFDDFNGFYAAYPNYILVDPIHNLLAVAAAAVAVLALLVWSVMRLLRRRRQRGAYAQAVDSASTG